VTTIIESVSVNIQCTAAILDGQLRCPVEGQAVIVSTVERGDLVLFPVHWLTETQDGQIIPICPNHGSRT
jgi:hypothetical protein